jgi:hypothetical protein
LFRFLHSYLYKALYSGTVAIALILAGCASTPNNATPNTGVRIIVTMSVAGDIDPNYHYFVAIDTSGQSSPGPLPVVGPPWGNGWGTGNITNYIIFDAAQPQGGYGVYQMVPGTNLLGTVYVGPPINITTPPSGSNRLQFTIDLGQLATPTTPITSISQVNINFITTDIIPLDPNYSGPKYFDALGPTGNDFITISLNTSQIYSNSQTNIESAGDVAIPNLDIVDWSVEVQRT